MKPKEIKLAQSTTGRTWLIQWRSGTEYNIKSYHTFKDAPEFVELLLASDGLDDSLPDRHSWKGIL